MTTRRVLAALRFLLGAITLIAIGTQLGIHISHGFPVFNFFSYFTNLSNLFAALVLLIESVLAWRGKELGPVWQFLRLASVVCMALVGIVFSALLRDVDLGTLLPWVNTWLHYVMPIAVVLEWLVQSPRKPIPFRRLWFTVLFPIAYLVYALARGAIDGWYAYPFLNPANGGYGTVAITCVGIAIAFIAVSAVLLWAANKLRPLVPPVASAHAGRHSATVS